MTSIERLRELDRWLERKLAGELDAIDEAEEASDEQAQRLLAHAGQPLEALARSPAGDPEFGARLAAALAESGHAGPGEVIGPFRIEQAIGSGGMGVVYRARRVSGGFEQTVALKVLGGARPDASAVGRFERERDLLSRLEHPGIARLIDGGLTVDGRPWFAMEYIEGRRVDDYCRRHRLGIRSRVSLVRQVCEALDYAHGRMVLHRDIKPANILVDHSGRVRLVDFGLGGMQADLASGVPEATQLSRRWLTPEYASPEQFHGKAIDVRSEVYQLGLVMYRLLCADSPYETAAESPAELMQAVTEAQPVAPSERWRENVQAAGEFGRSPKALQRRLRGDLDRIVLMALRKEAERRYPSARALGDDLQRHLDGRPVEARRDGLFYRMGKFFSRHPRGSAASALGIVLAVSAVVLHIDRLEVERDRAQLEASRATAITGFLVNLFESVDPERARGTGLTVREVLEQGGRELEGLNEQPAMQAELAGVLARVHRALGDYQLSVEFAERALELTRLAYGENHLRVASSLNNLGQSLTGLARYADAENAHRHALSLVRGKTPVPAVELSNTHALIGSVLRAAGSYQESVKHLAEALVLRETVHGKDSPEVARTLSEMAMLHYQTGEYDKARSQWQQALQILGEELGREHATTVRVRSRLAAIQRRLGDFEGAVDALSEIVQAQRRIYGNRHPAVATGLFELGFALYSAGQHSRAGGVWEECLDIQSDVYDPGHPQIANTLQGLAAVARARDDLDRAEELLVQVKSSFETQHGLRSSPVASTLNNMGTIRADRGDLEGALDHYRQSLDIYGEVHGDQHANVAAVLHRMGEVNLRLGHASRAAAQLERALQIREAALPENHPRTVRTREVIARLEDGSALTAGP